MHMAPLYRPQVSPVSLAQPAHAERTASPALQEPLAKPVLRDPREQMDSLDHRDRGESQDHGDRMETLVLRAVLGLLVKPDPRVRHRNLMFNLNVDVDTNY